MKVIDNLNEFVEQVDNAKKVNPLDLSKDQDLTIAIMNLISREEHLEYRGAKTEDNGYYDMIERIRENRKELMQKIIKTYKGEVWCISKHLLASSMRLMEVGTKLLHQNDKHEAYEFFKKSYDLYCMFWGINLNSATLDIETITATATEKTARAALEKPATLEDDEKVTEEEKVGEKKGFSSTFAKFKNFVNRSIDCCRE
ncbi:MAG: hypothetical protein LBG48_06055 [Rickettsiales bacterium]|jgi:hypothetical protein|nr:hypothetical protein [Rickettsiales bacterium]